MGLAEKSQNVLWYIWHSAKKFRPFINVVIKWSV